MTLLRVHGVSWSTKLCSGAAYFSNLALLQWLHSHSCPWEEAVVLFQASLCGSLAMLEWLLTVTAPWSSAAKLDMLHAAACHFNMPAAQWLRAHGAVWPDSFRPNVHSGKRSFRISWDIRAVRWALACGSGWLDWVCEDYAADKYTHANYKQQAAELLEWAHANGCPCTCGHVQQQQQQQ
jgi:hypothetical protein